MRTFLDSPVVAVVDGLEGQVMLRVPFLFGITSDDGVGKAWRFLQLYHSLIHSFTNVSRNNICFFYTQNQTRARCPLVSTVATCDLLDSEYVSGILGSAH